MFGIARIRETVVRQPVVCNTLPNNPYRATVIVILLYANILLSGRSAFTPYLTMAGTYLMSLRKHYSKQMPAKKGFRKWNITHTIVSHCEENVHG